MFFLKGLDSEHRQLLREHLHPIEIQQHQCIFSEGNASQVMFFLEFGSVLLTRTLTGPEGGEETVSVVKPGEFFGEEALLGEKNVYQFSAKVLEAGILQTLSQDAFERIMSKSAGAATKILLEISRSYREVLDGSKKRGAIFLFYGPRDGGGRTTLAVNMAILLSQQTRKAVGFLDADFQLGNAAVITGCSPVPNIAQLVQAESDLTIDRIKPYLHRQFGVDFLWGPEMPQDSEIVNRDALRRIVRELAAKYDYLVIESKCHIDEQTLYLWDEADRFCLIGTPNLGFLERVFRLQRLFQALNYDQQRFIGVMTMIDQENRSFLAEYEKVLQRPVVAIGSAGDLLRQAELQGQPLAIHAPGCGYMRDVETLMNCLLNKEAAPRKTGGLLSRLAAFFG
jgi:MinD-like ATPase involved in chromosome partitioning or flagellar assembly